MKKIIFIIVSSVFFLSLGACKRKKYTEVVVEVPLPSKGESITIGSPDNIKADEGVFKLLKLPYKYEALAPHIDARTMELHYSKHYLAYTNNLNKSIAGTDLENLTIEEIFKKMDINNTELRNNLGGYYNHTLYFDIMAPKMGGKPKDTLLSAIEINFGTFENFKLKFEEAASKQFGSGWAWLIVDKLGKLQVTCTPNQDNPLMPKAAVAGTPILGIDVWEHAYYLNYQNKRKKYIEAFFNVINWEKVGNNYEEAISK